MGPGFGRAQGTGGTRATPSRLQLARERLADTWFDLTRNVRTTGDQSLEAAEVHNADHRDSEAYQSASAGYIRHAIAATNLKDPSPYTFIDIGSGRGRALFVAAELPFARILGVEFSPRLHQQALANIRSFRPDTTRIESIHANARNFTFPPDPLVLFFFNPFGADTMRLVMHNLQDSLYRNRRHVVVILLCPQCPDEVLKVEGMTFTHTGPEHQIFEVDGQETMAVR